MDSFRLERSGCEKMKGLSMVEMDQMRQLILALVGRVEVGCVSGYAVDEKVGEAMRELLGRAHRSLE